MHISLTAFSMAVALAMADQSSFPTATVDATDTTSHIEPSNTTTPTTHPPYITAMVSPVNHIQDKLTFVASIVSANACNTTARIDCTNYTPHTATGEFDGISLDICTLRPTVTFGSNWAYYTLPTNHAMIDWFHNPPTPYETSCDWLGTTKAVCFTRRIITSGTGAWQSHYDTFLIQGGAKFMRMHLSTIEVKGNAEALQTRWSEECGVAHTASTVLGRAGRMVVVKTVYRVALVPFAAVALGLV